MQISYKRARFEMIFECASFEINEKNGQIPARLEMVKKKPENNENNGKLWLEMQKLK